jgi:hypothetical protein
VTPASIAALRHCGKNDFTLEVALLLRFSTRDDLVDFLNRLKNEAPDLYSQAKPSYSQPTVLNVRNTDSGDEDRIKSMTGHSVKTYSDVGFGTT